MQSLIGEKSSSCQHNGIREIGQDYDKDGKATAPKASLTYDDQRSPHDSTLKCAKCGEPGMLALLRMGYSRDYTLRCTNCGTFSSLRDVIEANKKPEPEH